MQCTNLAYHLWSWRGGKGHNVLFEMSQNVRADLHGTIFVPCDNGLRQAHEMIYDFCVRQKKCRSILKQVLKCCDNRKSCRRPVVCLSHATKIVPCKSSLIRFEKNIFFKEIYDNKTLIWLLPYLWVASLFEWEFDTGIRTWDTWSWFFVCRWRV